MPKNPEAPFPGFTPPTAPTQITRIHGRYATCTFAGIGTLNCFDWEMEIHAEFADATAHGDFWDVPVPLKYLWTARVRGYFDSSQAAYLHAYSGAAGAIAGGTADITAVSFVAARAVGNATSQTTANPIFTANGYLVRAHWAAPMGMVEQEAEIRGSGAPGTLGIA